MAPAGQPALKRLVDEPCAYVTRSWTGKMAKFQRGIGRLVAGSEVQVVPCHLSGAFEAFPPHRRFPLPRSIVLTIGAPIRFSSTSNSRQGWTEVAERLEAEVRRLGNVPPEA